MANILNLKGYYSKRHVANNSPQNNSLHFEHICPFVLGSVFFIVMRFSKITIFYYFLYTDPCHSFFWFFFCVIVLLIIEGKVSNPKYMCGYICVSSYTSIFHSCILRLCFKYTYYLFIFLSNSCSIVTCSLSLVIFLFAI